VQINGWKKHPITIAFVREMPGYRSNAAM